MFTSWRAAVLGTWIYPKIVILSGEPILSILFWNCWIHLNVPRMALYLIYFCAIILYYKLCFLHHYIIYIKCKDENVEVDVW